MKEKKDVSEVDVDQIVEDLRSHGLTEVCKIQQPNGLWTVQGKVKRPAPPSGKPDGTADDGGNREFP